MKNINIFLCHSSKDKPFVRKLGNKLREFGFKVWIDEAEIKIGDSLLEKISLGLYKSKYLAIILSKNSVKSPWVSRESDVASVREINKKHIKVLPILYKDCKIPIFLQNKLYADFRKAKNFNLNLQILINSLFSQKLKKELFTSVKQAIEAEFKAYKNLPSIIVTDLKKCFHINGSAYIRILHLLERHRKRRWVINNHHNPSTNELFDIQLNKIINNKAYIKTREYWYLRWFNLKTKKYGVIYDVMNQQNYILSRDTNSKWKVLVNQYKGEVKKTQFG